MSSYTNGSAGPEKVMFRIDGKTYNNGTQEGTATDNATSTFYPFDEVVVAAGATVDLGNSTFVKVVALDASAAAPSRVGDTGDIANTDPTYDLKVMFKEDGKTYNNGTQEGTATDNATSTFYPFDEALVPPGKKFNSAGTKVVKTVVMVPGPDAGAPNVGGA